MDRDELKAIVENILLAADEPVTVDRLAGAFQNAAGRQELRDVLKALMEEYAGKNLQILEVAEGYLLSTRREYSDWVKKYLRLDKASKLSQPALVTLSLLAYKQPITRAEVEDIRGVDSSGVIKTLLEKKLVGPAGRKKVPGRPMMYRTTQKFLDYFGLKDLKDLPTLEDFKEMEISGERVDSPPAQTKLLFAEPAPEAPNAEEKLADAELENCSSDIKPPGPLENEPTDNT